MPPILPAIRLAAGALGWASAEPIGETPETASKRGGPR